MDEKERNALLGLCEAVQSIVKEVDKLHKRIVGLEYYRMGNDIGITGFNEQLREVQGIAWDTQEYILDKMMKEYINEVTEKYKYYRISLDNFEPSAELEEYYRVESVREAMGLKSREELNREVLEDMNGDMEVYEYD